jgi:hypothetical protein
MANIEHRLLGNNTTKSHGILWSTVADAAALALLNIAAADVDQNKVVEQTDTGQMWIPTSTGVGATFKELFTGSSIIGYANLLGGYQTVATLAARNAIPAANRVVGMTVYEVDTDQMWRLIGGIANGNWVNVTVSQVSNTAAGLVPAVGAVSTILQSNGTASTWVAPLTWADTFLSPTIQQTLTASATGQKLSIYSQQAATTGGAIEIGSGIGGTTVGEFRLFTGATQFGSFQKSNANDFLAFGNNPAATGRLRLPPGAGIVSREFAFGSDLAVYTSGTADNKQTFGSSVASTVKINGPDVGGIGLQTTGTDRLTISSTTLSIIVASTIVGAAVAASGYTFSIVNVNSGSAPGGFFRIRAMGTTSGNTNGQHVELEGGRLNGTGLAGGVKIKLNADDTQANMSIMMQAVQVVASQRVSSFNFPGTAGAGLTSTQMPANTGDLVTYIGNAATNPSADAVSGHVYYSDGAKPAWRFNSTNLRLDGTAATATAGAGTLPATPEAFLQVTINGTTRKIPYYNA